MKSEVHNLFADIPPAQAMNITVSREWNNGLELSAPFDCNRNDKGTAFAGSIASLLTLTGWALLTLKLHEQNLTADIMVVASDIQYTRAAKQELRAVAEISDTELKCIRDDLKHRQRSRARLTISLRSGDTECATTTADYAIIQRG